MRLELLRFFFDPQDNIEKRCANVQVNNMMAMLNEHLEPPGYEDETPANDSEDDDDDEQKGKSFFAALQGNKKTENLLNTELGQVAVSEIHVKAKAS